MNHLLKRQRLPARRRGVVVILVIVCLGIAAALQLTLVQDAVSTNRQLQQQIQRRQAWFLAESGLSRAQARLLADADYGGETWQLHLDAFRAPVNSEQRHEAQTTAAAPKQPTAEVRIEVSVVAGQPHTRRVTVTALFPLHAPRRSREQIITNVELPSQGESP